MTREYRCHPSHLAREEYLLRAWIRAAIAGAARATTIIKRFIRCYRHAFLQYCSFAATLLEPLFHVIGYAERADCLRHHARLSCAAHRGRHAAEQFRYMATWTSPSFSAAIYAMILQEMFDDTLLRHCWRIIADVDNVTSTTLRHNTPYFAAIFSQGCHHRHLRQAR